MPSGGWCFTEKKSSILCIYKVFSCVFGIHLKFFVMLLLLNLFIFYFSHSSSFSNTNQFFWMVVAPRLTLFRASGAIQEKKNHWQFLIHICHKFMLLLHALTCNLLFLIRISHSAGKSFVAEILMLRRVISTGKMALLVLPYVSICTEKVLYCFSIELEESIC